MMQYDSNARVPLLLVVSAPSGAGKTTLCERLLEKRSDIVYSVSCTTRPRRGSEVDGVDYRFLDVNEFEGRVSRGEFLEHATVHGHRYGTLRKSVESTLEKGRHVLMDIDVQGAAQVRERVGELPFDHVLRSGFVDVFILPPSIDELRRRLVVRGEDSPDVIETRLRNAKAEMREQGCYAYRVVNTDIDEAFRELVSILETEETRRRGA